MNRSVSDILSQSAQQSIPQVRRIRAAIIDVLFPSRSFVVLRAGYGRQVVPADSSIDFGSYARPLVGVGNFVWIELNESDGTWHATKYEANSTCTPTTLPNAPNVPLTTYKPPQNTAITFEPFRVDTNFFPHVASIGLLAPAAKSPPGATGSANAKLSFIGKYLQAGTTLFSSWQQAMLGDYLFMVDLSTNAQMVCWNASDIHHLAYVSSFAITNLRQTGLVGAGKYLYCWSGLGGAQLFNVVDASNPYAMALTGTLGVGSRNFWGGHASVWSRSGSTYVTYTSKTAGVATTLITTINVTTPATPTLVGDYALPGGDYPMVIDVEGKYVYTVTYQNNLKVLDYSTPATPTVTSTTAIGGSATPNGDLIARQDYIYVAMADGKIYPVDVSNKAAPVVKTGIQFDPSVAGNAGVRMMLSGSYLVGIVYGTGNGLVLYQIIAPDVPTYVDRYTDYFTTNILAFLGSMFVKGRFIYGAGTDAAGDPSVFVLGF